MHPWFARWVAVHEAIDKSDGVVFRCSLSGSDADRWLEVPAWMFDRSACARVRVATDGEADLVALTTLATLLRHVLNHHFASSNAPLSGASRNSLAIRIGERSMPRKRLFSGHVFHWLVDGVGPGQELVERLLGWPLTILVMTSVR